MTDAYANARLFPMDDMGPGCKAAYIVHLDDESAFALDLDQPEFSVAVTEDDEIYLEASFDGESQSIVFENSESGIHSLLDEIAKNPLQGSIKVLKLALDQERSPKP